MLIKNTTLEKPVILEIIKDVIEFKEKDPIVYEILDIVEIKNEDSYGGYRVRINCELDNIRQVIPLDIATGDIITYRPVDYEYKTIFSKDNIKIMSYNLETMLAEKLETIYSKGMLNSRSKDFYDVYLLFKLKKSDIDFDKLSVACDRTFKHRGTELDYNNFKELLQTLITDKGFNDRWKAYANKNSYVDDLSFKDIIESILSLLGRTFN